MVRIFFLPYLGNRSKSDPCSYELFCLESHILSFSKVLQIPPESPCIYTLLCVFVDCSKLKFVLVLSCASFPTFLEHLLFRNVLLCVAYGKFPRKMLNR